MPRFGQAFSEHCEQNFQDTIQLKQRFLDAKNKRVPKNKDRKQESIQSSVHVQQKFLKRSSDDTDPSNSNETFEPPVKLQCTTQQHGTTTHPNEGLTKFSVEIVQQLEFTTSAANSQPQQISTNVTVKAHTNASVKSDVAASSPKSNASAAPQQQKKNLADCVKQEPENDFADLDQCAAALEKDAAANGGTGFGGFSDLIGEDTNDEIITSDAFNDLISDISNYPELMKDFDFEDKCEPNVNGLKVEDIKDLQTGAENVKSTHGSLLSNQNYSPPVFENQAGIAKNRMPPYSNIDFYKTELSPAAQTLKQMAEQHQHKNQMGMSFNPPRAPTARSPYSDFQFQGDYGSPNSNSNFHKGSPGFTQPEMIKQEMIFQNSEFDMKRKGAGIYKQQYSPYSSPSASSHGSPGYLPPRGSGAGSANGSTFGGGTPPRPSSGPGGNGGGTTLQINQAQQLHINQQSHGAIQVSAGQHLHLSGELKGNVSIAAQQGMHFNQHTSTNGTSSQSQHTQNVPQQSPLSSSQQQQQQQQQSQQMHTNNSQQSQQQSQSSGPHLGNPMMSGGQQMPNPGPGNMQGGMMGGTTSMQHPGGMSGNLSGQMTETYSMSQSQTINFTQQTLRQRAGGPNVVPNNMGPNVPMGPSQMGNTQGGGMGPRLMNPQALEQQKLLQQQQMLRAQQAALQQHLVRPPPPDYKSSAGMMQGVQPRFAAAPPSIRRMPPQPMPPSGPMIRPHNVYMMQQQQQQQHIMTRNMYPRQQGPLAGMDTMQHSNTDWRHLLMQQQNSNFNPQIRPNMQQGFNMNSGGMQISAQHQQLRNQQSMNQAQVMGQGGNPMSQMNNMNQMLNHMQQQQNVMQQQSPQMSIHMQQTQSMTITNQAMLQQNMNNQLVNTTSNQNNPLSNFNTQNTDFIGLEFLDNLPATDSTAFTDQELLNSFDSDSGFNLDF